MTVPASPGAVDTLRKSLAMAASDPGNVVQADGTKVGYKGERCMGGWIADAILAGPLAPVLSALQRVTAERDEARERVAELEADVRAAVVEASNQARARGEAEGALRASELAGIVDDWRERAGTAEAALATATAEAASLRAEVEAKDRARSSDAQAVIELCDSVLGNACIGKAHEDALAGRVKAAFMSTALARAATAGEG